MEIDLLRHYPKPNRDTSGRSETKTEEVRAIARQFGREFFDGDRKFGYGGFRYMPRFWQPVVPDLIKHFNLKAGMCLLDVGCAKGFMLYDLLSALPDLNVQGVDVSEYAILNAKEEVKAYLKKGSAKNLSFNNSAFDVVISINTLHNLDRDDCGIALQEIMRVSKGKAFITVDAYRNEEEEKRMYEWNLTAKTIMHVDGWKSFFKDVGYTGDYYWFVP